MSSDADPQSESNRQGLLSRLLDSVKECQLRFGGKGELASEADSRVSVLCSCLENCLKHGIKPLNKAIVALKQVTEFTGLTKLKSSLFSDTESDPVLWHIIRETLSKHELERFNLLHNVDTDIGRGRAWLRAALNEKTLGRQLIELRDNKKLTGQFYEDWSLMRDAERSNLLCGTASGLAAVCFAITIDVESLNSLPAASIKQEVKSSAFNQTSAGISRIFSSISKSASDAFSRNEQRNTSPANVITANTPAIAIPSESRTSRNTTKQVKIVTFDQDSDMSETDEPSDSIYNNIPRVESQASVISTTSALSDAEGDNPSNSIDMNSLVPLTNLTDESPHDGSVVRPLAVSPADLDAQSIDSADFSWNEQANTALNLAGRTRSASYITRTQGDGSSLPGETHSKISAESMSANELRQALVTMMLKKEEVEEQNRTIREMLLQEEEHNKGLKAELEDVQENLNNQLTKEQTRVQALTRDNGLLKHQLKKYITAVQMLRSEGAGGVDNLGIHVDTNPNPVITPSALEQRASQEAAEYKQKLIQVAEMHGELMEFNEHLQKQLIQREHCINKLRNELVSLRGPLPLEMDQTINDDYAMSEARDPTSDDWRPLVNIWMPCVFLKGAANSGHHVYQIYLRIKDDEWTVYRRYSELYQFYSQLKKSYPITATFEFPPKKALRNKGNKFVEDRRLKLQAFLRQSIQYITSHDTTLRDNLTRHQLLAKFPTLGDQPTENNQTKKKSKRTNKSTSPSTSGAASQSYTGL